MPTPDPNKTTEFHFSYGLMLHETIQKALLGHIPTIHRPGHVAWLHDHAVVIQNLEHIPNETVTFEGVPLNPRETLEGNYGKGFRSFTLIKSPGSFVPGKIVLLTPLERKLYLEWEMVGWGWFQEATGVRVTNGASVTYCTTEVIGKDQEYDRRALATIQTAQDRVIYDQLDNVKKAARIAEEVAEDFWARHKAA